MSLYEIIKALQNASGSNAKLEILKAHKDDELLKEFMRCVNSPAINFYQKKIAKHHYEGEHVEFSKGILEGMLYHLAERNITGRQAERWLGDLFAAATDESKMLIQCVIDKSIGAGVGETIVLKVWPDLFFVPGYMRCSLMNDKIKKHFESLDEFIVQKKADGQYVSLYLSGKAFTRNGTKYPDWLVAQLLRGRKQRILGASVLLGEVVAYDKRTGLLLNRQDGNGLINSALKGADESDFSEYCFCMECWDMLPEKDFEAGLCNIPYKDRFDSMQSIVDWQLENVMVISTYFVNNLEDAYAVNNKHLAEGMEGSVIKTLAHHWKDHTSPYNVKLKVAFEAEYVVTGVFKGEGKYKGMLGGYNIETSDGLLKCSVGTGFTDTMRKNPPAKVGDIITVIANDVISNRNSDTKSLFLPVYSETRLDKKEADSLERVMEQLNAAKGL